MKTHWIKTLDKCTVLAWLLIIACAGNIVQLCYWSYQNERVFTPGTYSEYAPAPSKSEHGRYISIESGGRFWYFKNGSMEVLQRGYCVINDSTCVLFDDDGDYYGYAYLYRGKYLKAILDDGSKLTMKKTLNAALLPEG